MPKKGSQVVQVNLRLPDELRGKLADEARKNERSFNAELVHRLQAPFVSRGKTRRDTERSAAIDAVGVLMQHFGIEKA